MTYDYKACPDVIAVAEALVSVSAPRSPAKIAEEIRWIMLDKEIRLFAARQRA